MKLNKYQKQAIVTAIMADVPAVNVSAHRKRMQDGVVKLMSPAVRKVYKESPDALTTRYFSDLYDGVSWGSRNLVVGNVPEEETNKLYEPLEQEVRARHALYCKLKGVIESCSTLKKLKELLPEFEAYFPTEDAPTKNLPAVANLVTDMMQMGWPKDKRKLPKKEVK